MTNFASIRQTQTSIQSAQKSINPITKSHFQAMLLAMILSLAYVTYTTQFSSPIQEQSAKVIQKTQLGIKDDANGDILIELIGDSSKSKSDNVSTSKTEQRISQRNQILRFSGEQGFLRGTLRALARERHLRNINSLAPFELALHEDGRFSITDPLTNKGIDLEAFGPDNVAVFAQILNASVASNAAPENGPTN